MSEWLERLTSYAQPLRLEDRKWLQIARAKGVETPQEWIHPKLHQALQTWEFPWYFLDFETITLSVPNHGSGRPYHTYVPQFSVHVLHQDGQLEQHYYLSDHLDDAT
ncbi:DUF2779 domain-containing protein, partial [Arthrospira platensis SPKY1]|nr:DUF2779 domain-containing protein [Arthrospira platensis SPKY1]